MSSTDRCDRSHKSGPLFGAQKSKEQKAELECSLLGTSKTKQLFQFVTGDNTKCDKGGG